MRVKTTHSILVGDARQMLSVPDGSVQLVMTSPPRWGDTRCKQKNGIGSEKTFEDYNNSLNLVWKECHRILAPGGRMCVQASDQLTQSSRGEGKRMLPVRAEIICFCESIGLDYMGGIVCGDRMPGSFSEKDLKKEMQSDFRDWAVGQDCTFVLLFRKPGRRGKTDTGIKGRSEIRAKKWNEYFCGHWSFRKRKKGSAMKGSDTEIAKRCIRMFSFAGDTILDPFSRDGTTIFAAHDCRRSSIAYTSRSAEARKVVEAASNPEKRIGGKRNFQIIRKEEKR